MALMGHWLDGRSCERRIPPSRNSKMMSTSKKSIGTHNRGSSWMRLVQGWCLHKHARSTLVLWATGRVMPIKVAYLVAAKKIGQRCMALSIEAKGLFTRQARTAVNSIKITCIKAIHLRWELQRNSESNSISEVTLSLGSQASSTACKVNQCRMSELKSSLVKAMFKAKWLPTIIKQQKRQLIFQSAQRNTGPIRDEKVRLQSSEIRVEKSVSKPCLRRIG